MSAREADGLVTGDIFQVVPSHRFRAPFTRDPFALYRSLRRSNPSPFLFFLDFGGFAVVGSSPEILVRLRDGTVTVRPIAGTRRHKRAATTREQLDRCRVRSSDLEFVPAVEEFVVLVDEAKDSYNFV